MLKANKSCQSNKKKKKKAKKNASSSHIVETLLYYSLNNWKISQATEKKN